VKIFVLGQNTEIFLIQERKDVKSPPTNYPGEVCLSDDLALNINAAKPHLTNSVPFGLAAVTNEVKDHPCPF
jgi:hypothetical protein